MARWKLQGKLTAVLFGMLVAGAAAYALLAKVPGNRLAALALTASLGGLAAHWVARRAMQPLLRLVRALAGTVASYRDGLQPFPGRRSRR